ncbi:MAG: 5-oxoprolinase subunit B family protein [Nonlabens sp.]|uniref:5-oxoprolinase subunit B family protein n=1 Tax=Nonlabens sp. TaxID=1888209 RepID=UPI003EF59533
MKSLRHLKSTVFKLGNSITYHQMNENSLLITFYTTQDTIIQWRRSAANLITKSFGNEVVINHGFDSILVLWKSQSLKSEMISSIKNSLNEEQEKESLEGVLWKLPVYYDKTSSDMTTVCEYLNLDVDEVIQIHKNSIYTVSFIGFLPGFPYLDGLDNRLMIPRKSKPSLQVESGSVAIAAGVCGIYPQNSPGGWYVLGNCPVPLFNKERAQPFLLQTMDEVQFYEVDKIVIENWTTHDSLDLIKRTIHG